MRKRRFPCMLVLACGLWLAVSAQNPVYRWYIGAAIIRLGITYDENPAIPSMGDVAYTIQLPKPFGGELRTSLISSLVLVDLRQDVWKNALGEVE